MPRTITEVCHFSYEQILEILKSTARSTIIGQYYQGSFQHQSAQIDFPEDGTAKFSITIFTTHTPYEAPR